MGEGLKKLDPGPGLQRSGGMAPRFPGPHQMATLTFGCAQGFPVWNLGSDASFGILVRPRAELGGVGAPAGVVGASLSKALACGSLAEG